MKIHLPKNIREINRLYGSEFLIIRKLVDDTVFRASFDSLGGVKKRAFEKVTGLRNFMNVFTSNIEALIDVNGIKKSVNLVEAFIAKWQKETDRFRQMRKKYLLYD